MSKWEIAAYAAGIPTAIVCFCCSIGCWVEREHELRENRRETIINNE